MNIWYAIPAANMPMAAKTLPAWLAKGYKLAVYVDGEEAQEHMCDLVPRWRSHVCWPTDGVFPGWATAVNYLATMLVREHAADIVVTGGDDVFPAEDQDAQELGAQFAAHFPDMCGVMQPTGDGFSGNGLAAVSPWLGSEWVARAYGGRGPLFDGYDHYCADTELRAVAVQLGRYWERPDVSQYHDHWTRQAVPPGQRLKPWPHLAKAQASKKHDRDLFVERRTFGYPGAALLPAPVAAPVLVNTPPYIPTVTS